VAETQMAEHKRGAGMILIQILLLILVAMMVVMLYKLYSMNQYQWLKEVFIDSANSYYGNLKIVNIPHEIAKLKGELAPLFYLPLASEARDLKNLELIIDGENRMRTEFFQRTEISEMEEFAKSHSSSEPFTASDSLKDALKEWAISATNRGRVDKLVQEYKQRLMNVVSGNVFVEKAEKSLRKATSFVPGWLIFDEDKSRVDELYNQRAGNWQAGKWLERLESLREVSKLQADFQGERSGAIWPGRKESS
jgi:hypothetical protein